jgi:FKBP-type peptidyl-prolyl cis-trans isomerase
MRRFNLILLLLSFVSTAVLFAQTAGQQTSTKAATSKATTSKVATAQKAAPVVPWVTTPSGLKYRDVVVGKGPQPKVGDTVVVNYTGKFMSGKVFDTSVGKPPFTFRLGHGEVIKGWDEGVGSMHVGGKRRLLIPPALAYGKAGYPGVIPPNSTLRFDVELLKIR